MSAIDKGDINIIPQFVLAGDATFTVSNQNGKHYTYNVAGHDDIYGGGARKVYFVSLLIGPDTWAYMGMLKRTEDGRIPTLLKTRKSRFEPTTQPWRTFQWALRVIWQVATSTYRVPIGYSLKHQGVCGRCKHPLTHPASLDTGLGPECAAMLGVEWREHSRRQAALPVAAGEDGMKSTSDNTVGER